MPRQVVDRSGEYNWRYDRFATFHCVDGLAALAWTWCRHATGAGPAGAAWTADACGESLTVAVGRLLWHGLGVDMPLAQVHVVLRGLLTPAGRTDRVLRASAVGLLAIF